MPASVPMVLTSSGPLTLTNGDSSHSSPPRVILHTVPSTTAGGKDVLTIQTASLSTGTGSLQDAQHQLLVSSLCSSTTSPSCATTGVITTASSAHNGLPRLVTFNTASGQPMVAQQPGTVIATVLKSSEFHGLQVKEEILDPHYLQSLVNMNPSLADHVFLKEELEEGEVEQSYRTVIFETHQQGAAAQVNGHFFQSGSPSEGLTPVEELEVRGEMALQPEHVVKGLHELPVTFIQVKTEPTEA